MGVCYRPPDQNEELDEAFFRLLAAVSVTDPGSCGEFNYLDICWRSYSAKHKQSRRFLESTDDNFLSHLVEVPTRNVLGFGFPPFDFLKKFFSSHKLLRN